MYPNEFWELKTGNLCGNSHIKSFGVSVFIKVLQFINSAFEDWKTSVFPLIIWSTEIFSKKIKKVAKGSRNRNFDCRFLVNATGAWGDRVSRSIEGVKNPLPTRVIKSTHIEFREHLSDNSFYVEGKKGSNRIAILPWRGGTLVGSADTMFSGNPERVTPSTEEVDYLVGITRHHFPHFQYEPFDAWSGLRLSSIKQRAILPRRSKSLNDTDERYLCVRESQFASYRATAERVVISVMRSLSEKSAPPPETHYICSSSVRIW